MKPLNNKLAKFIIIISVINTLFLITNIILLSFNIFTTNNNKIFYKNINSIVEIKAQSKEIGSSFGSGIIYKDSGYILTNAHIISFFKDDKAVNFEDISIRFTKDNNYTKAQIYKVDYKNDLAIIKIDNHLKYQAIKFSSKKVLYGDIVYAIGNTSNYGLGISKGVISIPRLIIKYENTTRTVIQVDLNISSGNSGGALLDNKGSLIGITTFRTKDEKGKINYGFVYAIPIDIINDFIKE